MNKMVASPDMTKAVRKREREARATLELQPHRPVRLANEDDYYSIMALLRALHAENGQHALSTAKVERLVRRTLSRDYGALAVIGEVSDVRALMLLLIDEVYYSDERQIIELCNFVRADSRRSSYGRQLLEFAMQMAALTGMHLTCGIVSDVSLEAKRRMYERILGDKSGAVFIYRPEKALEHGR